MNTVLADTASWALILSLLSPLLISMVQQPQWTPRVRSLVGAGAALLIGTVTVAANGGFDQSTGDATRTWLSTVALVFVASATAYKSLWQKIGLTQTIEAKTSGVNVVDLQAYRGKHRADGPADTGEAEPRAS